MQKIFSCLVLVLSLSCPVVGNAAYVIKLKNGNEFVTGRYWQEGGQVLFDTYGGVFGIEKRFVSKIEESNRSLGVAEFVPQASKESDETVKLGNRATKKKPQQVSSPQANPNDPILKEFTAIEERFKRIDGMLTNELRRLLDDMVSFKRKARQSEKVNDYNRQLAEVNVMADKVEAALQLRNQ